ncbi:hypothetical protein [Cronobacter sakazakii]|uniref:hypothetical protein n=1 Tax=Cronobacter sakazakii TaxID=28141 RepID=UPI0029CA4182|nr:hypothetical protein [Cronobacter sakazakii]
MAIYFYNTVISVFVVFYLKKTPSSPCLRFLPHLIKILIKKIGVIIILSCYGGNVEHDFTKGTELDKKVAQNNWYHLIHCFNCLIYCLKHGFLPHQRSSEVKFAQRKITEFGEEANS